MNYQRHYDLLIERARNRTLEGYCERHHVIPVCMGGGDEKGNLVKLTAEEHYVAHQLLVKMYPENYKLVFAANRMTHGGKDAIRNNKLYSWMRKKFSKALSRNLKGRKMSKENFLAIMKANTCRLKTIEEVDKIRKTMTGKPPSRRCQEASKKSSKMRDKFHSEETLAKMKLSQQLRREREKLNG